MPEPLLEELNLDIAPALAAIDTLDAALAQVTSNFSVALSDALQTALATSLDVPLNVDTTPAQEQITALDNEQLALPLEVDTTAATNEIEALGAVPVEPVAIDADTSAAQDNIDALGSSATGASSSVEGLKGQAEGLAIGTELAAGKTGGLTSALEGTSGALGAATAGGVAFAAFLSETVGLAADAQAQQNRFNQVFGQSKEVVESINVGGLTTSFADLAKESGTAEANLQASASRIGLIGTTSGVAQEKVAEVVQQVIGLGGALSVQNPRLGDAATVTDRLTLALARGGPAAAKLGLSIPTKEVAALAQEIAGAGNQVTQFDKLQAGLQLTLQNTGNTLGTTFAQGTQNAQVQLRALRTEVEESLVAIGKPLLGPAVDSVKEFVPIVQQLGRVLGELGQIVLPVFAALGPAAAILAAALGLIADGLHAIPSPVVLAAGLLLFAGGVDGAAIALFNLVGAIEAVTVALLANPFFLAAAALAAVGFAAKELAQNWDDAGKATEQFNKSLFANVKTSQDLTKALADLDKNLANTVQRTLDGNTALGQYRDIVNKVGGGHTELTKALSGTNAEFEKYKKNLTDTTQKQVDGEAIAASLTSSLDDQRKGLLDSEKAQLNNLVSSGQLEQKTLDQVEANHKAEIAQGQYTGALKDAAAAATVYTARQADQAEVTQQAKLETNLHSGAMAALLEQLNAGKIGTAEFTAQMQALGVVEKDAKTVADDHTTALAKLHDNAILASSAAQSLDAQFAQGAISGDQLEQQLFNLGVGADAAKAKVAELEGQIKKFVDGVTGALPSVGDAVSSFSQGIVTAFGAVVSAGSTGANAVDSATKSVASAKQTLDNARASAGTSAQKAIDAAQASADAAQARLTRLEGTGTASAAAIANAQSSVDAAQKKLATTIANSGSVGASGIKTAQQAYDKALADLRDANNKANAATKKAHDDLLKAVDPQTFIDSLTASSKAIADFTKNLATLTSEGFGELAGALAAKGPQIGGQLAQAFVGDRTKAALGEKAVESFATVTDKATAFAKDNAGALGGAGASIATSINEGFRLNFGLTHPSQEELDKAAKFVEEAAPNLAGKGAQTAKATVLAYEIEFGHLPTITEFQTGAAATKIADAATPTAAAAKELGAKAAGPDGFAGGIAGVAGATDTALGAVKDIFAPQGHVDTINAARSLGRAIGVNFDIGIRQGINDPAEQLLIFDAAKRAGEKAVAGGMEGIKAKSPSEEGIRIGGLFVEGVALGLQDARPVEDASAALAASIPAAIAKTPVKVPVSVGLTAASVSAVGLATPAASSPPPPAGANAAGVAAAGAGKNVSVRVDLHKVDIDPLHLATELGYRLG